MFEDRVDAGRRLAARLVPYALKDPVVLALPRGGVPVAAEIAAALHAPLDVLLVRKIGAQQQPELAVAAVAEGDDGPVLEIDDETFRVTGDTHARVEREAQAQWAEIERRRVLYREGQGPLDVAGRAVIVVDDGIATGTTLRAALRALRARRPARIVLAVPVAPPSAVASFTREVDEFVCLEAPFAFWAVGQAYHRFEQTSDEEVVRLLHRQFPPRPETRR